ncbi:hypothetical protein rosag_06390 [Roseisolibacter agri]|uniref:Uncharacterized protein n=1 Tax=Roseisolibacter agri TaxID=2014610 RepID=A0AA37Q876_9BACT|nr:hypothetical protein rosag_06390 [Roseisolibacter agri]
MGWVPCCATREAGVGTAASAASRASAAGPRGTGRERRMDGSRVEVGPDIPRRRMRAATLDYAPAGVRAGSGAADRGQRVRGACRGYGLAAPATLPS